MKAVLIVNPKARQVAARPRLAEEVTGCLARRGIAVELWPTTREAEATELAALAATEGRELVVVAGGDGTINEAVNGLVGTETALGIVPLGTGNVLGHYLGLTPGDVEAACRLVAEGQRRRVDAGSINGRHFVCMASVGLDAEVVVRTGGWLKRCLGTYAFVAQFIATVARERPWAYEGTLDGQAISGRMWGLFISNTAQYTVGVRLIPDAVADDGRMEFVFLRACSRAAVLGTGAAVYGRGEPAATQPHMEVLRGTHLTLATDRAAPWQVEGEVGGVAPVECVVHPRALTLVAPGTPDTPVGHVAASVP